MEFFLPRRIIKLLKKKKKKRFNPIKSLSSGKQVIRAGNDYFNGTKKKFC